jgi:hypothetical protein
LGRADRGETSARSYRFAVRLPKHKFYRIIAIARQVLASQECTSGHLKRSSGHPQGHRVGDLSSARRGRVGQLTMIMCAHPLLGRPIGHMGTAKVDWVARGRHGSDRGAIPTLSDAQATQGSLGTQGACRAAANSEPDRLGVRHVANAGGLPNSIERF